MYSTRGHRFLLCHHSSARCIALRQHLLAGARNVHDPTDGEVLQGGEWHAYNNANHLQLSAHHMGRVVQNLEAGLGVLADSG